MGQSSPPPPNLYNFFSSISLPAPRQNQLSQRVTYCNTGFKSLWAEIYEEFTLPVTGYNTFWWCSSSRQWVSSLFFTMYMMYVQQEYFAKYQTTAKPQTTLKFSDQG